MNVNILKYLKDKIYLIIPIMCNGIWPILYLIEVNFILHQPWDFINYYVYGKYIFENPSNIYKAFEDRFYFMPNFALAFGISISLFPLTIAHYIFYIINYILAVITIKEFDKILMINQLVEKKYRFLFLMIISNGWIIYRIFYLNQSKYIVAAIFFYVVRRSLEVKEEMRDFKFYFINYNLLIFAVGTYPFIAFFVILYLLQGIRIQDYFKKKNIQKYLLMVLFFFLQNFLFLIYPNLIFDFLSSFNNFNRHGYSIIFYLRDLMLDKGLYIPYYISIISTIYLIVITIFLILKNNLPIDKKFAYLSLACIFFNTFGYLRVLVIYLPLSLLAYAQFINEDKNLTEFIKNKILIFGIFSIIPIYFWTYAFTIFNYFPFLRQPILEWIIYLRYVFFLFIYGFCLFYLSFKEFNLKLI
ncbi:MAG: hypothetical protein ACTSQJ_05515 [Promethearchaeota archaeon]